MFCVNCGNQLDEGAKFCRFCGTPAAKPQPAAAPAAPAPAEKSQEPAPVEQAASAAEKEASGQPMPAAEEAAPQPSVAAPQPSVAASQPSVAASQPTVAEPQPSVGELEPAAATLQSSTVESQPLPRPASPAAPQPEAQAQPAAQPGAQVSASAPAGQTPQPMASGPQAQPAIPQPEMQPYSVEVPQPAPQAAWQTPPAPEKKRGRRVAIAVAMIAIAVAFGCGGFFAGWLLGGEQDSLPVDATSSGTEATSSGETSRPDDGTVSVVQPLPGGEESETPSAPEQEPFSPVGEWVAVSALVDGQEAPLEEVNAAGIEMRFLEDGTLLLSSVYGGEETGTWRQVGDRYLLEDSSGATTYCVQREDGKLFLQSYENDEQNGVLFARGSASTQTPTSTSPAGDWRVVTARLFGQEMTPEEAGVSGAQMRILEDGTFQSLTNGIVESEGVWVQSGTQYAFTADGTTLYVHVAGGQLFLYDQANYDVAQAVMIFERG